MHQRICIAMAEAPIVLYPADHLAMLGQALCQNVFRQLGAGSSGLRLDIRQLGFGSLIQYAHISLRMQL